MTTVTPGNAIVTYHVIVTKATRPLRNGNADFHSTADSMQCTNSSQPCSIPAGQPSQKSNPPSLKLHSLRITDIILPR